MSSGLPAPRIKLQQEIRLRRWMAGNPEHRAAVTAWLASFRADPFDTRLRPFEWPDRHGERRFQYVVPGAPLVVVVVIERYPDDTGVFAGRVIYPRLPTDRVEDR